MADTLTAAIALLNQEPANNGNFAARLVREAVMPRDYFLATVLPEENRETYSIDSGSIAIYPTMAGMSGMDSTYAPVGAAATARFLEESAKITSLLPMSEKQLREIQALIQRMQAMGSDPVPRAAEELVGFTMVIAVAHWDTSEFLRSQAVFNGALDWTYNGKELTVSYGVPSANLQATRTSTSAYDKSASTFWADQRAMIRAIGRPELQIMNRDTFYGIVDNSVNAVRVEEVASEVSSNGLIERYRLTRRIGNDARPSDDARDSATVVVYQREGSVIDPSEATKMKAVTFVPTGKIAAIGSSTRAAYRPGRGSQPDLMNRGRLGYHHIAPTTEADGTPGRWARVLKPQDAQYMVRAEGVSNELPVIETPDKLYILSTEIGA